MAVITDETAGAARSRTDLIAGLHGLIDHIAVTGANGFPGLVTIQLPVPDAGHEGKHAWLERVAVEWDAEILPDGMGGQWAEKSFGSVRLVASVACPARGVFDYQARAAASAIAANGATA
jgi:hypothetical protein